MPFIEGTFGTQQEAMACSVWASTVMSKTVQKRSNYTISRLFSLRFFPLITPQFDIYLLAGRNVDFLALLDEATDNESKAKLLGSLVRADKTAVVAIGRDESCMQAFSGWLEELIPQRRSFYVLELLLKVGLPASQKDMFVAQRF